jgi:hypothetical protein
MKLGTRRLVARLAGLLTWLAALGAVVWIVLAVAGAGPRAQVLSLGTTVSLLAFARLLERLSRAAPRFRRVKFLNQSDRVVEDSTVDAPGATPGPNSRGGNMQNLPPHMPEPLLHEGDYDVSYFFDNTWSVLVTVKIAGLAPIPINLSIPEEPTSQKRVKELEVEASGAEPGPYAVRARLHYGIDDAGPLETTGWLP